MAVVRSALLAALALGVSLHVRADAAGAPPRDSTAKIATRAELDSYLADTAANPFDALSPGARERFLVSLQFGPGGLAGMDPNQLADELDDAQIHAVLTLFGQRVLPYAPKSHVSEIRAVERRVTRRAGIGPIERQYNDFYAAMRAIDEPDEEAAARAVGALFDTRLASLYQPGSLRGIDDHELRLLRVGARSVALETREFRHVEAFERVFAERERRDIVSTEDVASLRELFVALRRFAEARALAAKYPQADLAPLPQFRDGLGKGASGPTIWRLDASGKRLTRAAIDLAPLQIVVAASGHLSRDAARDISSDALLGPVFEKHAQWLVLAPGVEPIERARRWNEELPQAPVAMLYDREEWRALVPRWIMPTFFFIRDGKVVDSTSGWASGEAETRNQLIAALRRNGLLPAQ